MWTSVSCQQKLQSHSTNMPIWKPIVCHIRQLVLSIINYLCQKKVLPPPQKIAFLFQIFLKVQWCVHMNSYLWTIQSYDEYLIWPIFKIKWLLAVCCCCCCWFSGYTSKNTKVGKMDSLNDYDIWLMCLVSNYEFCLTTTAKKKVR